MRIFFVIDVKIPVFQFVMPVKQQIIEKILQKNGSFPNPLIEIGVIGSD